MISPLAGIISGSIGMLPSASLCGMPGGPTKGIYEPVHGSAPDIAGKKIANPIGQIWSGAMMLEHLGEEDASKNIITAIENVLSEKRSLTPDMGGNASTEELGKAIEESI